MSGYLQLADGRVVPVHDGIVIGRVAGCDCVLDDPKASRRHARVVVEGGVVEIEDLESSNGTLLNGKPVTRRLLRPGDQVQIGKAVLTYREGAPPGAVRSTGAAAARSAAAASDDDDDLFGGDAPTVTMPKASLPPPPPPPPPQAPVVRPAAASPPVVPRQSPVVPRQGIVEFADEVVEVRTAPTEGKKSAAMPAASAPIVASGSRVLQYTKHAGGGGLLGDDLTQMSGATRSLLYAGVLLIAVGIVFGIVYLMR